MTVVGFFTSNGNSKAGIIKKLYLQQYSSTSYFGLNQLITMTGEKLELMQYKFVGIMSLTKGLLQLPVLLSLALMQGMDFVFPPPYQLLIVKL